uniref:Calpain catalytic domain-containing protein n=1 Tax=Rhabditophanes sp. KR3021 TaxID=114890 RepID=A0AC35UHS4_9BILA
MGFLNNNKRIFDQDYNKIKKICIKNNSLFIDTTFPPTDESLFLESGKNSEIVWKRPSELVDNPKLFVEGASFGDVQQGILGNCWCLSAFLGLTLNKSLMNKVLPDCTKQEWNSNNHYVGIFKFSFWRYGKWENIIIDDLLPTKNNELLFARSKTPNEFWPALLEKAFAKMYGCYENLSGGQLSDALLDVSGGVPENIVFAKFLESEECDRNQKISKLFKLLEREFACQSLMVAAIGAKGGENEEVLSNGLILRHAYAITAVRYIELDAKNASFKYFSKLEKKMMIRLRNPWAEGEYNGAWSDASEEWNQVSVLQKKELGIVLGNCVTPHGFFV